MRIAASEFILFCNPPAENVERLSKYVPEVELMIDGDAWDHGPNGWQEQIATLKDSPVPFTVHPPAWDVNAASPIGALRDAAAFLNKRSVELCAALNASQMVFHPGYYDSESFFSKTRARDFSYKLLDELIVMAKPQNLTIAFENIAGPSSALFTEDEYIHALDGIDPCVKFLLDVGHAQINGWNIPRVIEKLGDRLAAFHLHDNDGRGDTHLPIGRGSIDWDGVFGAMKSSAPKDCIYIMEYQSGTPLELLTVGADLLRSHVE